MAPWPRTSESASALGVRTPIRDEAPRLDGVVYRWAPMPPQRLRSGRSGPGAGHAPLALPRHVGRRRSSSLFDEFISERPVDPLNRLFVVQRSRHPVSERVRLLIRPGEIGVLPLVNATVVTPRRLCVRSSVRPRRRPRDRN